mmetsp:Transcript_94496/g.240433  ORF Transcript_94496/g.240433 Transcript_94496/m.240433 type:complete len:99 (+) Transcript_94496:451-747(+)
MRELRPEGSKVSDATCFNSGKDLGMATLMCLGIADPTAPLQAGSSTKETAGAEAPVGVLPTVPAMPDGRCACSAQQKCVAPTARIGRGAHARMSAAET